MEKRTIETRLGTQLLASISHCLLSLRSSIPLEFSRKTRAIDEVERWKATEFRTFLLYTGPVVLNGQLPEAMYKNFLLLSVGIHFLLSPSLCEKYVNYAQQIIVCFVKHFGELYGNNQLVYNVHCLTHVAAEARKFGHLDNISAFPFENFLGKVKRMVRKPDHPLQQIIRRLSEKQDVVHTDEKKKAFWKSHVEGPVPDQFGNCEQFSFTNVKDFTIGINRGNNTVQINNEICQVRNILYKDSQIYVVYQVYRQKEAYFVYPLDSTHLDIFQVSNIGKSLKVSPL